MRKLFVSFTSLLRAISSGTVTAEDLDQGFFMFGCFREHALNPGGSGEHDERTSNPRANAAAYPILRAALLKAESERRALWLCGPERTPSHPYAVLNLMLLDHGISPVLDVDNRAYYSYPGIHSDIAAKGVPLTVIF